MGCKSNLTEACAYFNIVMGFSFLVPQYRLNRSNQLDLQKEVKCKRLCIEWNWWVVRKATEQEALVFYADDDDDDGGGGGGDQRCVQKLQQISSSCVCLHQS